MAHPPIANPIYLMVAIDNLGNIAGLHTAAEEEDIKKKIAALPDSQTPSLLFVGSQLRLRTVKSVEITPM